MKISIGADECLHVVEVALDYLKGIDEQQPSYLRQPIRITNYVKMKSIAEVAADLKSSNSDFADQEAVKDVSRSNKIYPDMQTGKEVE